MALATIIVNPSFTIEDYEREYIVFFSPVLEQDMIGNTFFKIFETYIYSHDNSEIYIYQKKRKYF